MRDVTHFIENPLPHYLRDREQQLRTSLVMLQREYQARQQPILKALAELEYFRPAPSMVVDREDVV